MARNLEALLPLVLEYGPDRIAFCTDDRDPDDIADNGHINGMVRDAVALRRHARGRAADGLVPPRPVARPRPPRRGRRRLPGRSPPAARPRRASRRSSCSSAAGRSRTSRRCPCPSGCARPCGCEPVTAADFAIPSDGRPIRAIGLIEDQVVTESLEREPVVVDGHAVADAEADLAKIAVVERHLATGRIGLGFVCRLGPAARRARLVGGTRRTQPRRRRDERRRHGVRRRPPRPTSAAASSSSSDGRVRRRVPPPGRGPALGRASRRGDREQSRHQRGRRGSRLVGRDPVPDAGVPRALRDPVAEDHRPRPRRRRPVRDRPSRSRVMTEIRTGLTYDDVLLVPRRSRVRSRQDVSTRSSFTPRDRARGADRLGQHGHGHDGADGGRDGAARRHRRPAPVPRGRGGGGRGATGQALPHPRRRGAVRDRARPDARPGPRGGRPARRSRASSSSTPSGGCSGCSRPGTCSPARTASAWRS